MLGITFSAEAEPSAAERISDCFQYFESRMDVVRQPRYCKVLDTIKNTLLNEGIPLDDLGLNVELERKFL